MKDAPHSELCQTDKKMSYKEHTYKQLSVSEIIKNDTNFLLCIAT